MKVDRLNVFPACALGLLLISATSAADDKLTDRVVIRPKGSSGQLVLQCAILDYTGRTIILKTVAGTTRTFPSSQVLKVQTPQTPSHVQGLVAFQVGDYKKAVELFESALAIEKREWVRRDLLALLVRCALQEGNRAKAAERFVLLVKSDPSTLHFHLIPLVWAPTELGAELKGKARQWLLTGDTIPRLIGASMLLFDARYGKAAAEAISGLEASGDLRIQGLARMQSLRRKLREQRPPTNFALQTWKKQLDGLPASLKAGPCYLLGKAYHLRKEYEQAAEMFLWIPLVYADDRLLAARACLEAADSLALAGQKQEAITLYNEVRVRYQDTEFAQEAAAQLKAVAKSSTKPE